MWWYGGPWTGMMAVWWGWHMVVAMLFWIGILALGIIAVRTFSSLRRETREDERPTALAILQKRYARGEIGRDEYTEKRRDISASSVS